MRSEGKHEVSLTPVNPLIIAAHELKTPLVLMRQLSLDFADSLKDADFAKDSEIIAERMRLTSEKTLRLVDSLTQAARLEDGLFELEPIRLSGVFREITEEILPLSNSLEQKVVIKNSRKITNHSASSPVVIANRSLLRSLMLNILDNSLQHNNSGESIEISSRIRRKSEQKSGFDADVVAEIEVRDYGNEIDLHDFRKLRENLGSVQPISNRPLSSGLGLAIAEIFANKMGGELNIVRHSKRGGLSFTITLPISRQMSLMELL